jgi:hypothetical protein
MTGKEETALHAQQTAGLLLRDRSPVGVSGLPTTNAMSAAEVNDVHYTVLLNNYTPTFSYIK